MVFYGRQNAYGFSGPCKHHSSAKHYLKQPLSICHTEQYQIVWHILCLLFLALEVIAKQQLFKKTIHFPLCDTKSPAWNSFMPKLLAWCFIVHCLEIQRAKKRAAFEYNRQKWVASCNREVHLFKTLVHWLRTQTTNCLFEWDGMTPIWVAMRALQRQPQMGHSFSACSSVTEQKPHLIRQTDSRLCTGCDWLVNFTQYREITG